MDNDNLPDDEIPQNPGDLLPLTPVYGSESNLASNMVKGAFVLVGTFVGAYVLFGNLEQPGRGATRSSKLRWEEQQAEIERAECDAKNHDLVSSPIENKSR